MKPLLQKLPVAEQTSFVARTYTTPLFETAWHRHPEFELILQRKGKGMCFVGNYIGDFAAGDVFLLGSNLPHEFKKESAGMECSVMVIHFDKDFWGKAFWAMPESAEIVKLLDHSKTGFKLSNYADAELCEAILRLEVAQGFERITLLCQCLLLISRNSSKQPLSTLDSRDVNLFADDRINAVFEYTINHFTEPIALVTVASLAHMSTSAFCRYFKRATKRSYLEFLNGLRIGQACHLLLTSEKTILQICYDCGFNTVANFNKQFLKAKALTPSHYKKKFKSF